MVMSLLSTDIAYGAKHVVEMALIVMGSMPTETTIFIGMKLDPQTTAALRLITGPLPSLRLNRERVAKFSIV